MWTLLLTLEVLPGVVLLVEVLSEDACLRPRLPSQAHMHPP